jgi:hypothetical protein
MAVQNVAARRDPAMQTKINCSAYFVPADGISLPFF